MSDRVYRMTDAQLPQVLAHLAEAGGTARSVESWRHDQMTALLLGRTNDDIAAGFGGTNSGLRWGSSFRRGR